MINSYNSEDILSARAKINRHKQLYLLVFKKVFCIFFLFLILAQSVEFSIYFEFKLHEIHQEVKHKIKAGVPNEALTRFQFSTDERDALQWTRKNEFLLNGVYYDVVRMQEDAPNEFTYFCIKDTDEKELFAFFEDLFHLDANDLDSNHPIQVMVNLCKVPFLINENFAYLTPRSTDHEPKDFFGANSFFSQFTANRLEKPPQFSINF